MSDADCTPGREPRSVAASCDCAAMMLVGGYDGVTSLGIPIQRQSLIGCVRRVRVDDVRIHLEKHRRVSPDDDVISFCRSP